MAHQTLFLNDKIKSFLTSLDAFDEVMQLQGVAFRNVPGRKTIQITIGEHCYFIKQHFGVGWKEIFKNLITFKKPIISAMTEKLAIEKLSELGIATTPLVGFGVRGCNPAKLQSFIITEDLGNIVSLEDLCKDWVNNPPPPAFKRALIIAVAQLAGKLHANGLFHRDFYLCHFCLDAPLFTDLKQRKIKNANQIKFYLIDLHRMLLSHKPNVKQNMKDIAALYFSAKDIGLTLKDLMRFQRYYRQAGALQNADFWQQVMRRSALLYARFHSAKFQQKLINEKTLIG